jgi:hypothetical protein
MRPQNDGGAPSRSEATSEMPRIQSRFAFESLITVPGFREIGRNSTACGCTASGYMTADDKSKGHLLASLAGLYTVTKII